ncbi:hypothetical protein [Alicyclobacillus fodiniaquatilis]|uniref:Uncharacterized protein n=1 Tax=Alicyclobacillus fodiniaquatilis TaxID=1661150 RepID=A0ABW4JJ95_9BACL
MSTERTRKVRSDKKIRVNPPLRECDHYKLERLAIACGLKKTHLAETIISMALNTAEIINHIQDVYEVPSSRRVIPQRVNGGEYTF